MNKNNKLAKTKVRHRFQ